MMMPCSQGRDGGREVTFISTFRIFLFVLQILARAFLI